MNILLLCNKSPWPPKDGGASATLNIIKGLSACKASVTVIALNTSRHFTGPGDIPSEIRNLAGFNLVHVNTRINPFLLIINLMFSTKPYNLTRFRSDAFSMELRKMLNKKFDIVQIEGLAMTIYHDIIEKYSSGKMVYRPHNVENIIWSGLVKEERNLLKRFYFRILSKRIENFEESILNKFDAFVPISPTDLKWFKERGLKKPVFLSQPGFEPQSKSIIAGNETKDICFIGALDWLPNVNGLIWFRDKVWTQVIREMPETKFYIAGRNPTVGTSRELQGKNIRFEGEVDSFSHFVRDKSIMVIPLFSGSGIRMKILEGMNEGKCIITTPTGAEGLICEDRKNIFIAKDANIFADLIIKLLKDKQMVSETGRNAAENVRKNYNIFASSEKLLSFYRELNS